MTFLVTREKQHKSGILHFSQKVDYGLFLLVTLAKQYEEKTPLSLATIAKEHHLSFFFLQKIACLLRTANLIQAARGKQGGYTLTRHPRAITMKEALEALDGPITMISSLAHPATMQNFPEGWCTMRRGIEYLHKNFVHILSQLTLFDFTRPPGEKFPYHS